MQVRERETLDWWITLYALQVAIDDDYLCTYRAAAGNQESVLRPWAHLSIAVTSRQNLLVARG